MILLRQLALVSLATLAACSATPTMELSVTPVNVPGDGESPVKVTAHVLRGGSPPQDSVTVHFTATDGTFVDALDGTPNSIDVAVAESDAIANLIPPRRGRGTIDITASVSMDGQTIASTKTVTLKPAGQLANSLTFSCATQNVGGLVPARPGPLRVLCTARAFKDSTEIKGASIEAFAEAGHLEWLKDDSGVQKLIYTIDTGSTPPKDVDPLGPNGQPRPLCPSACAVDPAACDAEPCWVESGTSVTHNPRDGVATLMVAVPAVAGFFDFSSNGEPFVDADDDKARTPGETYIDVNGNGKYDSADDAQGQSQDPRMLWKVVRMVWSGKLHANPAKQANSSFIKGQLATSPAFKASLRFHDKNYNKLAAVGEAGTDAASVEVLGCGSSSVTLTVTNSTVALNQDSAGILFDEVGDISSPGLPSTYRRGTDYVNAVTGSVDADPVPAHESCTVKATLSRRYAPTVSGFESEGELSSEAVEGAISW